MPWIFVSATFLAGLSLVLVGRRRGWRRRLLDEAVPECAIAELEPGRFRVRGRVVPLESTPSHVDGVGCVYLERAEYRTVGLGLAPLLKETEHRAVCHPFLLQDETGRILVDPSTTLNECATASADGGLTIERRLRTGEELTLTATFGPVDRRDEDAQGPYRSAAAGGFAPRSDATGPPRLTYRTLPAMVTPPPDLLSAFLGGAGGILVMMAGLLAFVLTFMV
ncbi:MAG: hypothetical protein ACFCGT_12495 [Sandaracinaceae bacterium]